MIKKLIEKVNNEVGKIKGYNLIKTTLCDSPFVVYQKINPLTKKPKSEYIRIVLVSSGWNKELKYYWILERSFKPFNYKHNHREGAEVLSESFKDGEIDKGFNYFLNLYNMVRK